MLKELIKCLETAFGRDELEITRNNFTNCGVKHRQLPNAGGYEICQVEYIGALKPIASS